MNSIIKPYVVFIFIAGIILTSACEEEAPMPFLNVTASETTVNTGDTVHFQISGNADAYSIFTGERGSNYDSSFLAIAAGQDLDMGALVLSADSLDSANTWIQNRVIGFNIATKNANEQLRNDTTIAEEDKVYQDTVVLEEVIADLQNNIVGKVFVNETEAYYVVIRDAMTLLDPGIARSFVDTFFEDQGTYLAPEGGYDTGEALDRYDLDYSHVYIRPGTFTVTVIATNVSNKKYSGPGYLDDRTASASEYHFNRQIRQITITVQ